MEIIRRMRYERLFFLRMDAYVNLVYEFYSSLRIKTDARNNIQGYTIEFRLHDRKCTITPEMLARWLDYNDEGILNTTFKFRSNSAWDMLGGQKEYDLYTSKLSKMANPVMRMLHRIISYILNSHHKSNGQVIVQDVILMYCGVNNI